MKNNKAKFMIALATTVATLALPLASLVSCNQENPEIQKYKVDFVVRGEGTIDIDELDVNEGTKLSEIEDQINPQGKESGWEFDAYYYESGYEVIKVEDPEKLIINKDIKLIVQFINPHVFVLDNYLDEKEEPIGIGSALYPAFYLTLSVKKDEEYKIVGDLDKYWLGDYHKGYAYQWVLIINNIDEGHEQEGAELLDISNPRFYIDGEEKILGEDPGIADYRVNKDGKKPDQYVGRYEGFSSTFIREERKLFEFKFTADEDCENLVMYLFAPELKEYTISGGSTVLHGQLDKAGSDSADWNVTDPEGKPITPNNFSIKGIDPSNSFPDWIKIDDNGKVYWTNEAATGIYKFKVKAEIAETYPIYSDVITLKIDDTYTISGGSTSLNGLSRVSGSDSSRWVVTNAEGRIVEDANFSIEGVSPSSEFPDWIKIDDRKVNWTNQADTGEYTFKVKATIEDVFEPVFSENITLNIKDEIVDVDNLKYELHRKDKTAIVCGPADSTTITDLTIPASIKYEDETYAISSIGENAFYRCPASSTITSVTIPDSVKTIGKFAFRECANLTSATIGNGVVSIEEALFFGCEKLQSIIIPNSVKSIGESAFHDCYGLTSVTIGNSVTSIGKSAFFSCKNLTSIIIPDSVKSISEGAFASCLDLTSVTIGAKVQSIASGAFRDCNNITNSSGPGGSHGFNFSGTMEQWKQVTRGTEWQVTSATEIQCSDGVCALDDK